MRYRFLLTYCALLVLATPPIARAQAGAANFAKEEVAIGAKLYAQHCSVCHGARMAEPGGGFFDLRTFPKAQRSRFVTSVSNGKNSMPPWRSLLTPEQIGMLWAYVATGDSSP